MKTYFDFWTAMIIFPSNDPKTYLNPGSMKKSSIFSSFRVFLEIQQSECDWTLSELWSIVILKIALNGKAKQTVSDRQPECFIKKLKGLQI